MSPIDFKKLEATLPEFAQVWQAMREAPQRKLFKGRYLDPRAVARHLRVRQVDPVVLMRALNSLVEAGVLRQVYVLVNPRTDDIVSEEYSSPLEIPDVVEDFDQRIYRDEADVVPLYLEE